MYANAVIIIICLWSIACESVDKFLTLRLQADYSDDFKRGGSPGDADTAHLPDHDQLHYRWGLLLVSLHLV